MKSKILLKFFLFTSLLFPFVADAQLDSEPINLPKYDQQVIHFGFVLGINSSRFVVDRVGDLKISDSIYSVESDPVSGFNLGILSNLRIGNFFDLRFIPTLTFCQRNLNYYFIYSSTSESSVVKNVESTYLEFPFDLKFKSKRINNYRIYVLGGFKYQIDMVSQAKVKKTEKDIIKLKRNDYGYEIGLGFDFYLTYFKFSPEIKMYTGLTNLLVNENTTFSSPIDALYSKTFMVSLFFE